MIDKPYSPACERNREPILALLREHFADRRHVLEVGSGTGQHAVHFAAAMPWLLWQCSDRPEYLPGIRLWLDEAGLANAPAPVELDVARGPWPLPSPVPSLSPLPLPSPAFTGEGLGGGKRDHMSPALAGSRAPTPALPRAPKEVPLEGKQGRGLEQRQQQEQQTHQRRQEPNRFNAAYSANTLHIMSWPEVEAFFAGLDTALAEQAKLAVYGPFNYGGAFTSDSNAAFDASLKSRDAAMGIRDFEAVDALARAIGLQLIADAPMPANNRLLMWRRDARSAGA